MLVHVPPGHAFLFPFAQRTSRGQEPSRTTDDSNQRAGLGHDCLYLNAGEQIKEAKRVALADWSHPEVLSASLPKLQAMSNMHSSMHTTPPHFARNDPPVPSLDFLKHSIIQSLSPITARPMLCLLNLQLCGYIAGHPAWRIKAAKPTRVPLVDAHV